MNRRYIALILVALLLPCCISVPARANEYGSNWINLMDYCSSEAIYNRYVRFTLPYKTNVQNVEFLIQTPAVDFNPYFRISGHGDIPLTKISIGGDSSKGYIYRLYGVLPVGMYSDLELYFGVSDTWCNLLNAECSITYIDSFTANATGIVSYKDGSVTQDIWITEDLDRNFSTPIVETNDPRDYRVYIELTDWKKYDYYTLTLHFYCSTLSSVAVWQGINAVPYTISYVNHSTWTEDGFLFTVRIDLRDLNREYESVPTIVFSGNLHDIVTGVNGFAINGCFGEIQTAEFEPEVTWLHKIYNYFREFGERIDDLFIDLIDTVSLFWQDVGTWFSEVTDSIATWGQNIVDAFNPDSEEAEEVISDAEEKGEQIGGLNDQMNSVVKPDLEGAGDISSVITPTDLTISATFLTTIVNAPYISDIMVLCLILSLAGYVLFGKRG